MYMYIEGNDHWTLFFSDGGGGGVNLIYLLNFIE
jgi:hypothetical protein